MGRWTMDNSPAFIALDLASRLFSPYDLNPGGFNPLRDILAQSIDFARLARSPVNVFVTATNVRTGRPRVFRNADMTPDALLASACLPMMFQAIEIDGEAYWDGGFSGNPTISPLVRESSAHDTILIQINPVERAGTPRSARDILNRENEIAFNAPLLKELRMIALLRQVADPGQSEGALWACDAPAPDRQRGHDRSGLFVQAQCRMGLSVHAARRGPALRRAPSSTNTARTWVSARPSTSIICWKGV